MNSSLKYILVTMVALSSGILHQKTMGAAQAFPKQEDSPEKASLPKPTGPLPRFATLKSSVVNLHVGPGKQYPISWKYVRQFLPLEIIAEFGTWRQIRDMDGTEGWLHQSLLSGNRYGIVKKGPLTIHKSADSTSPIVAEVEEGVLVKLMECSDTWCRVRVQFVQGWLKKQALWGLYSHERRF